jgi:hypothetical protein
MAESDEEEEKKTTEKMAEPIRARGLQQGKRCTVILSWTAYRVEL